MFKEGALQPQSIELLPVFEESVQDALQAAELTLLNLEAMKERPDILSEQVNESMIRTYEAQVDQLLILRKQCSHWHRTHYLTQSQKKSILELEKAISRLEKITQQILFIARHFANAPLNLRLTNEVLIFSDELFKAEFAPAAITAEHIDIMKAIHETVIKLAAQDLEGIEIFEATLDYMPLIDDIVSHNNRSVVMDYADHYPGFREYIILLEELSETMAGIQIKFAPDA